MSVRRSRDPQYQRDLAAKFSASLSFVVFSYPPLPVLHPLPLQRVTYPTKLISLFLASLQHNKYSGITPRSRGVLGQPVQIVHTMLAFLVVVSFQNMVCSLQERL